jgi:hypothetical protein
MDDSLNPALIRLRQGAVRRMPGHRGEGIAVFEGQVWVTQDGDPDDTILEAGQSHPLRGEGDVVVQAFADAVLMRFRADDDIGSDRDHPDDRDRLPSGAPRPPRPISAYALMRATREMRHAAIARAMVRAAGAVKFAAAWLVAAAARRWRRAGAAAVVDTKRPLRGVASAAMVNPGACHAG